jgi:hypothetical protein
MIKFRLTGKDINGQVELELLDEPFDNITFYYDGTSFADEENEDGSLTLSFQYILTGQKTPTNIKLFNQTLGDLLMQVLEEQIARNEVIYHGGQGGTYVDDSTTSVSSSSSIS